MVTSVPTIVPFSDPFKFLFSRMVKIFFREGYRIGQKQFPPTKCNIPKCLTVLMVVVEAVEAVVVVVGVRVLLQYVRFSWHICTHAIDGLQN